MAKKDIKLSPRGTAVFPKLVNADTKFDPIGYKGTKLFVKDGKTAEKFVAFIDAEMEKSLASAKENAPKGKKVKQFDPPYSYDEERGGYNFSFKRKAGGVGAKTGKPWTAHIALFDAANKPLVDVDPWGGSEITVAFEVRHTMSPKGECGVKLSPEAVQVHNLVAAGSRSAEGYGFQATESDEEEGETFAEGDEPTEGTDGTGSDSEDADGDY